MLSFIKIPTPRTEISHNMEQVLTDNSTMDARMHGQLDRRPENAMLSTNYCTWRHKNIRRQQY